jgi:hypothetical protein
VKFVKRLGVKLTTTDLTDNASTETSDESPPDIDRIGEDEASIN